MNLLTMPLGTSLEEAIEVSIKEAAWVTVPCNLTDEAIRACNLDKKGCAIVRTGETEIMIWNPGSFWIEEEYKNRCHQDQTH